MPVIPQDPFGQVKSEKGNINPLPSEVKAFHDRSDRDSGIAAEHHTLGSKRGQASPGDHIHDGKGCRKLSTMPIIENQTLTISGQINPATVAQVDAMLDQVIQWFATLGFTINDTRI